MERDTTEQETPDGADELEVVPTTDVGETDRPGSSQDAEETVMELPEQTTAEVEEEPGG